MDLAGAYTELLADAADLVGKGDLDRMPRIVDELGELGLTVGTWNIGA